MAHLPFRFETSNHCQKNRFKMPLPNKGGEPEFKLKVEPADKIAIKYNMKDEATVPLSIMNPTKERICYKVKCTDNEIFRVRPPLGLVEPGKTAAVKITLKPKAGIDPNRHFFAIYHVACSDPKADPRKIWTADTKPDGVIRMQALLETDEPAAEEKKKGGDDEKKEKEKDDGEKKEEKKE
ncbi:hypothetical protein L5515_005057 [Caenorhabditis briggsae]|uniref:Major sperm protein n=3 Tax=Caenorhabditis briggsae TaxID=6238 RepID=A0AAE9DEA6_CAEBR|nr:hypothetical protein L3Y34_002227 [Caenorhabditis briggsae]UMM25101.1 hypothetical protein L5515_005057 [Caenorhabditis briggsae]